MLWVYCCLPIQSYVLHRRLDCLLRFALSPQIKSETFTSLELWIKFHVTKSLFEICLLLSFFSAGVVRTRQAPVFVHGAVIATLFTNNFWIHKDKLLQHLIWHCRQTRWLAPCFPPAAERGARQRQQRRGGVNGRPALLRCEREGDRNQRSPLPREPNAETTDSSGLVCPSSVFSTLHTQVSFTVGGSERLYTQLARKALSASLTVDIEKLWIVLYTLFWWLSVNLRICVGIP